MVEERSGIWDFAAWSALAGGAAVGGSRAYPGLKQVFASAPRDIAQETLAKLRTMGRFNVGRLGNSVVPVDDMALNMVSSLSKSSSPSAVKLDIASATYESLLAGGRISHTDARQIYNSIAASTDATEAYRQAASSIQEWRGNANILADRLTNLGTGGIYGNVIDPLTGTYKETGRLSEISKAIVSGGEFGDIRRQKQSFFDLPETAQQMAEDIRNKLGKASGGRVGHYEYYSIRDVVGGKEVTVPFMRAKIGGEALNIPLANKGITYGGEHLTTRYLTRGAYQEGSNEIQNYTQRYVNALTEAMAGQKNNTALKNAVIDTNMKMIESLQAEGAIARSQAIWSLPEAALPAGGRVSARLTSQQAVYTGGAVTEQTINRAIGAGLFPYGSGDVVAKGTMYTSDIAEQIYGPAARLMSVEQRPLQFIRPEWGVTAEAKAAAPGFRGAFGENFNRLERKIQGAGYKDILYGGKSVLDVEAYSAPQLLTLYAKPSELETGKLGKVMFEEEMAISNRLTSAMEYEKVVQKKVLLDEGFRVNNNIVNSLRGKGVGEVTLLDNPINNGQFLGIERGTGRELWSEAGRAEASVFAAELSGDNTATLYMRQKHKLDRGDWWKVFSEDTKFLARMRNQQTINELASLVGVSGGEVAGQSIEAITSGKLVERNRMALLNQQTEAMSLFLGKRLDRGSALSRTRVKRLTARNREILNFLSDPEKHLGVSRLLASGTADAEFQIQKNMVAMANRYGFSTEELQLTFGLMDRPSLARLAKEGDLTLREAAQIRRSRAVVGLSKARLGQLASEGVGGLASVEQTGIRALAMKGESGQAFAAELTTRMMNKGEAVASDRMMASMLGAEDTLTKINQLVGRAEVDPRKLSQFRNIDDLLQETGRYVDVGQKLEAFGGRSSIYLPGMAEAPTMYKTTLGQTGKVIQSDVARGLNELRRLSMKGAGKEELEIAAERLRTKVVQATEAQSASRGKVYGSRFLTGIRQTADITDDTFRISRRTAEGMFDDLIKRAGDADHAAFLSEQKRRLIDEGESLVGAMWRHPTTGPESLQFVRYKVDKNLADDIISAPRKRGLMTIGGRTRELDFSQMVGMKGDFDKDMYALSAISNRDTLKRLSKEMDGPIQKKYTEYLFNHYAMKDLVDAGKARTSNLLEMSKQEALQIGAKKLTTAKIATPEVNLALQKLKLGMQYAAPDKYRPMAELFWHLEEAAIGGKHGARTQKLYKDIAHAVNQKDTATMESVIKRLMGEKDLVVSGNMTSPTGETTSHVLRYSPREYAEQAMNAAAAAGEDVDWAYKSARAAKGRGISQDINQLTEMYYKRRTGSLDVAQALMQAKDYGEEGVEQGINRLMRKAATKKTFISKALGAAKGPLIAGAAVAAGVMLAAPAISGSMPMREGSAGGKNLNFSDLGPPSGIGITPPTPRIMASPKVYDMSGVKMASRANIRMSMPDADRSSVDFMRQASVLANSGRVRVRTTDDREILSPQRLASKIHERL